jgi:hypothetical protein
MRAGSKGEENASMTRARVAWFALAAAALAAPALAQAGFASLFDGKSLAGWTVVGPPAWSVADGAASADAGATSFLLSDGSYRDFELRVEFWASEDANSGVFIRCASRTEITASGCYEVNIYDQRPDPRYGTGGIVDVAAVSPMPKAGGHWNTMVITAREDVLTVTVNGQTTVDAVHNAAHREGPFALQHAAGTIRFRKIEIRPL